MRLEARLSAAVINIVPLIATYHRLSYNQDMSLEKFIKPVRPPKTAPIVPSEYYTLADIVARRLFYYTSFSRVRDIIEKDKASNNILNPIVNGKGRGKKYLFKGENIIKFVKGIETGMVNLPQKTK